MSTDIVQRVKYLRDLGIMQPVAVGTRVLVEEGGITYYSVGTVNDQVARRIGWPARMNVWVPEHALLHIRQRHNPIVDPLLVAAMILHRAASIHQGTRSLTHRHFIIDADMVRSEQLLTSRTARFIDAIVELRQVSGGSILRLFHLSPCDVNRGGILLWP